MSLKSRLKSAGSKVKGAVKAVGSGIQARAKNIGESARLASSPFTGGAQLGGSRYSDALGPRAPRAQAASMMRRKRPAGAGQIEFNSRQEEAY